MKIQKTLSIVYCFFICAAAYAGAQKAMEEAEKTIWSGFISEYGFVLDYKGELPSPQECIDGRPNYLNWWGPTENAAMFTGLYLSSVCQRHMLSPSQADSDKARKLAKGLMLCASVSDVKGFISRGVSSDGKTHYPIGSEDQTVPWIYGMYMYLKSDIPDAEEKSAVKSKIIEVCLALDANNWNCPCDGKFRGQHHGELAVRAAHNVGFNAIGSLAREVLLSFARI